MLILITEFIEFADIITVFKKELSLYYIINVYIYNNLKRGVIIL